MKINKIYNEDNLETMKRMPDEFIDLTVTSPPYDDLRDYDGYSFDFENVAKELYRVTKDGGVVVWVVGDATINGSETGISFKQALYFKEIGFNLHDTMIYNRQSAFPEIVRYSPDFEYMFIFSKGMPKTFNPLKTKKTDQTRKMQRSQYITKTERQVDGTVKKISQNGVDRMNKARESEYKIDSNIWYIPAGNMVSTPDKIAYKHPAIFPDKLAKKHIYSWSNEGDLVYDPFGGSGTVAKMAHLQKRNWILSEMSKKYTDLAQKRIQPYLDQLQLF